MMYRPNQDSDWTVVDSFYLDVQGSVTDRKGQITIYNIKQGEYSLGAYNHLLPTDTNERNICPSMTAVNDVPEMPDFKLFPNPADDKAMVTFDGNIYDAALLSDLMGREILDQKIGGNQSLLEINLNGVSAGVYLVTLFGKDGSRNCKKLVRR